MKSKIICYVIDWLIAFTFIFVISCFGIWVLSLIFNFLTIDFPFDFKHVMTHIVTMSGLGAAYSVLFSPIK